VENNTQPLSDEELAHKTLEILPPMWQLMIVEMRNSEDNVGMAHMRVLTQLITRPYTLTQLAEDTSVTAPTMSNTITALENRGWVSRIRDTKDRRVVYIQLTQIGMEALNRMGEATRKRLRELIEPLNAEDRVDLERGLSVLQKMVLSSDVFRKYFPQEYFNHYEESEQSEENRKDIT
jgi:DNA-binding MarR family transcriptional regulator